MRPISWLHISDFHLRDSQAWAQDVVLSAMCKDIERQRGAIGTIDFVLATGDLAFAGKAHEYAGASGLTSRNSMTLGSHSRALTFAGGRLRR